MKEEGVSIKAWVEGKFEDAIEKAAKGLEQGVCSYDHSELMGAVRAYHNVLVKLGPANVWKTEYNVFNAWVDEICEHSPLTLEDAIDIYNFCDRNNLLKQPDIVENVIALGIRGHCRYDITNLLKLEALKGGKWIHRGIWRRKK